MSNSKDRTLDRATNRMHVAKGAAGLLLSLGLTVGCQSEAGSYSEVSQALVGECTTTSQCQGMYDGATDCRNSEGGVCYCGSTICADPYTGVGVIVPARIQAQEFVAASDTTAGNEGGQCTSAVNGDVDMQTTGDSQGGTCNIGWTAAGEWVEYDISAAQAGNYDIALRLAATTSGRNVTVSLDGSQVGTVTAPSSGWQTYANRTLSDISIGAGNHSVRVTFENGSANLNYLEIISAGGPAVNIPSTIEAEDFVDFSDSTSGHFGDCGSGPVDQQTTSDQGGGCNIGWTSAGEWLEYVVQVNAAGDFDAALRLASNSGGKRVQLSVDGNVIGTVTSPSSGWQVWETRTISDFALSAGQHTVRATFLDGSVNLNWIDFAEADDGGDSVLGRFDIAKDIVLCNYDGKPDEDDLHSVAGWATMLKDARFSSVNYHCTAGAYGKQGGTFIDEPQLFNIAFGVNWSSAHADYDGAVDTAADRAMAALSAGGDVWVAEAGQSDFTADVVRRIKAEMSGLDTNSRIHVVQHSDWNENQTTSADLSYVKSNTDYHKIADGNTSGNGTPGLNTSSGSEWNRAISDAQVGAVWQEARAAASRWFGIDWDNGNIEGGGMDFSDTVEVMFIFGFEGNTGGAPGFFDQFL